MFISQVIFESEMENREMIKRIMDNKRSDVESVEEILSFEIWWKESANIVGFSLVTKWNNKESFQKWLKASHANGHKKSGEMRPKITKTGFQFESIE